MFAYLENKNEEEREHFLNIIGYNSDAGYAEDDELIPAELRGVTPPSWWTAGGGTNPQDMKSVLGY